MLVVKVLQSMAFFRKPNTDMLADDCHDMTRTFEAISVLRQEFPKGVEDHLFGVFESYGNNFLIIAV